MEQDNLINDMVGGEAMNTTEEKLYTRADMIRAFVHGQSSTFNPNEHAEFFKLLAEKEKDSCLGVVEMNGNSE